MFLLCTVFLYSSQASPRIHLLVLDDLGVQTLGVLDVDGLDVRVQLLLRALLVVTLTRDADTETVWDTLDAGLPDLLVELGVEADVLGGLGGELAIAPTEIAMARQREHDATCRVPGLETGCLHTMAFSAKALISLMARGALFLKLTP